MSFIQNIKEFLGEDADSINPSYRALLLGDSACYLENVKQVISYTTERIELSLKKGGLIVNGVGLYLKKYCDGDLIVCGKISSIERI